MIIFDLDGTLADCEHRRHFVTDPLDVCNDCCADWKSFYMACDQDKPIEPVCEIFRQLHLKFTEDSNEIHIWSGRCESTRKDTDIWLTYNLHPTKNWFHFLKMRPIGDSTPDDLLKEKWLDKALAEGKKIDFVFDDRPKVTRMWRRRGVFVFDVNQSVKEF